VIITSNKEKGNLPAPFLRRCVYYYIHFPAKTEVLKRIVDLHLEKETGRKPAKKSERTLIDKVVALFLKIRGSGMTKPPSTSELLDWMRVLLDFDGKPYSADAIPDSVGKDLPYPEVLYKLRTDWQSLRPAHE
jgi:MoxR-like ATPase